MPTANQANREAVIARAQVSLARIALAFGLLNAVVPFLVIAGNAGASLELAFGAGWIVAWSIAIWNAVRLMAWLERPASRYAVAVSVSAVTGGIIAATGGLNSPLQSGGSWLGWVATVVLPPLASLSVGAILSLGTGIAYVLSSSSLDELYAERYTVLTGVLNPIVIVFVALALAGVFRWVIAAAPGTLWSVRRGGPASSAGLTALFRGEPIALLTTGDPDDDAHLPTPPHPGVALSDGERDVVDLLASGLAPKQIAAELGRSTATVYERIASAKQKVGAQTIEHLIVLTWSPA